MNADMLRASILRKALEGNLVPQLDEEPEVELLGETPDEAPFEIPEKWKWVLLGDIGVWKSGSTPSRSNTDYYRNGTVNWLKTGDLNDGVITKTEEKITDIAVSESGLKINPPGSILMAMYGATIGKVGILDIPSTTNQACCACVPENFVDNKYLFYFLLSQRKRFISMGAGGAQPNISKNKIVNFPFPLPPLGEQRRIVKKLEELLPLIEEYGRDQERLEKINKDFPVQMEKSLLQEAIAGKLVPQLDEEAQVEQLGDAPKEIPFGLPEKWKWVRLKHLGVTQTGTTPSTSNSAYYGKGIPFVKPGDLIDGRIVYREDELTEKARAIARIVQENSVLMVCIGSIGKCAINRKEVSFNQQINSITANESLVLPEYIRAIFSSNYFQLQLRALATGTVIPIINKSKWEGIFVPLPPLQEQRRIIEKLDKLMLEIQKLK